MTRNEIVFPLAEPPKPPESGLAEIVDGPIDNGDYPKDGWSEPTVTPPTPTGSGVGEAYVTAHSVDEYKKARRFHADTPFVLGLLLFLVALLAAASFYVSFSGLYAAAAWAVGDVPPLQFAVPIMLDVAIVAFTLALFVERERGERVRWTWLAIAVFALVSATANILHTLEVSTAVNLSQLIAGAVISGGAPILLAFATDKIAVKVFKEPNPVTK
jgi:hypothetical protein